MSEAQCRIPHCTFTDNRTLFNSSDVVIFSAQNLNVSDLPGHRLPHQRFVFYQLESPLNTAVSPFRDVSSLRHDYFNWTMTYRMDSDIIHRDSYGMTLPISPLRSKLPQIPADGDRFGDYPAPVDVGGKRKGIAWFVSNCQTNSRREDYVRQLRRYVDVDVFGRCSNTSCTDVLQCQAMLRRDYKFYLAFENSLCPDYVTEKLTRTLGLDLVPIVYGAVDYWHFAPPHSFIDVRDFQSVRQLASYIRLLDDNHQLYARYFDWKRDFRVTTVYKKGWCRLCRMAHDDQLPPKSYADVYDWWILQRPCVPPHLPFS